jgi:type II secretory pathway pseudopilin PulG
MRPADLHRVSGFSLIELVMIIIIIGIVAAGLVPIFSSTAQSQNTNETLQQATQYAQECAERAVATRQDKGFAWFATNTFTCGNPTGFARTVTVGGTYDGAVGTACPAGVKCRDVAIVVSKGSVSSNIAILLADY